MRSRIILKVLGLLLMIFSFFMLPPVVVGMTFHDGAEQSFLIAFSTLILLGVILWLPVRKARQNLRIRDGFVIVVLFWTGLSAAGALPFLLSETPVMGLTDAFFESVSGLTATGATVLTGLDDLPKSILFYRQELQFLGGMGIIVLAIAVLPALGIGGMQLFRAEASGPVKDNKLTPRITESAKALWLIYVGLTALCALCYWLGGMPKFDAVCYAFATISTGGYAPHDASMAYFNSPLLESICIFFMFSGAISFSLLFTVIRSRDFRLFTRDPELRTLFLFLFAATVIVFADLITGYASGHTNFGQQFLDAAFQVVAFGTTAGFTTANYHDWPWFAPILLILLGIVGGCAGSTSGGIKMIRFNLLHKQGMREIKRLIHPSGHFIIKYGDNPLPDQTLEAVWGFLAAFTLLFCVLSLVLMGTGLDFVTAFSATASGLANIGPALGDAVGSFANLNDTAKWVLALTMIVGRLEIFTVLVLFTRVFWRG